MESSCKGELSLIVTLTVLNAALLRLYLHIPVKVQIWNQVQQMHTDCQFKFLLKPTKKTVRRMKCKNGLTMIQHGKSKANNPGQESTEKISKAKSGTGCPVQQFVSHRNRQVIWETGHKSRSVKGRADQGRQLHTQEGLEKHGRHSRLEPKKIWQRVS